MSVISIAEHRDCMEAMKGFGDKFFDLAVVDPPYGIERFKNGIGDGDRHKVKAHSGFNNGVPDQNYFDDLFRVSKNQIIWGANNFELPNTEYFCIWNKQQTVDNFASAEYAWVSMGLRQPAKVFNYSIHKHNQVNKIHPTQKPIALYQWLLKNYAKPGNKILDTHLGSGSSRIAAYKMGFDFWGYELDHDYWLAQEKRFKQAIAEPLFEQVKVEQGKLI